jgi:cellulose synthase/poly-beta-1,6-N-acetylglucosamine synthase-like glycosyltransferase
MTEWIALLVALALATPLVVLGTECLVALSAQARPLATPPALAPGVSYAVLVPAHNEAAILAKTLARLVAQVPDPGAIVLVADNCTDATAGIARTLGVTVLERHDPDRRGKGFALDFGVRHLRAARPDVLVVMDADCETSQAALVGLINTVAAARLPAQMTYLMRVVGNASIKQKIAGFAWLLKNQVRPLAVDRLGLPVTLTGTGMAFPWQALETVSMSHGNIVEDMQLGIDCTLQGFPPVFCPSAQ